MSGRRLNWQVQLFTEVASAVRKALITSEKFYLWHENTPTHGNRNRATRCTGVGRPIFMTRG